MRSLVLSFALFALPGCTAPGTDFQSAYAEMDMILRALNAEPRIEAMTEAREGKRTVWLVGAGSGMSAEVAAGPDARRDLPAETDWVEERGLARGPFAAVAAALDRSALASVRQENGCTWFITGGWIDDHAGFARCASGRMPEAWIDERFGGGWYRYATTGNK